MEGVECTVLRASLGEATLIFNEQAGGSETCQPQDLLGALKALGYAAQHLPTASPEDLKRVLAGVKGTVFVAGGDGTMRAAAMELAGREDVIMGLIPMGTANNIGRTLGVQGQPLEVVAGYAAADVRPFDLGRVTGPWGEDLFLEACGCGAFADVLAEYNPDDGKSPVRAVQALASTLGTFAPMDLALRVDDQPLTVQGLAVVEVMNTKATGPRLRLATHADATDGKLSLIRVNADDRDGALAYLSALARDDFETLPSVQTDDVRRVQIPFVGQAFHVDGEVRAPEPGMAGTVTVEVWAGALRVLVPRGPERTVTGP